MPPAAARPSARYRSIVVVLILAFILLGFFALGHLSIDLPPSGDALRLNIRVSAPGLTAPVIEEMLTRRLETLLTGIPGVTAMESVTATGSADVNLQLNHRRDIDAALREVTARLERGKASWPAAVDPPTVTLTDTASASVEFNVTSKTLDALALRDWVEAEFARRLRELSGVAAVDVRGGSVREILVMPDQRRLAGYGLSFEDLLQAIRKNPEVDSHVTQLPVKRRARREPMLSGSLAAVAAIPVTLPDGESIRLSEVAGLTLSQEANPAPLRVDGAETIKVTVHKQAQAALSDVVARVRSQADWMRANGLIPAGIEVHPVSGRFDEARQPLRKMAYALVVGFVLVLSAVHLSAGRGRRTLIVGVIIAASLQGVFIAMALFGVALDVMTLGGLVLGTGLFGGSVLLMFEKNTTPAPVGHISPVLAVAVFLVAALVPAWFAGGELGALYREFIAVFVGAWLLAASLAWWLVPMFDTRRPQEKAPWNAAISHVMARVRQSYDDLLRHLLPRAGLVLLVAAVTMAGLATVLFTKLRDTSAPDVSPEQGIILRLEGPNSADLSTIANDITQHLRSLPELRQVSHSAQVTREEWELHMDEARAQELGVDIAMAGKALAVVLNGIPAGGFRDADHHYNVRMRLPPEDADSVATGKILVLGELEQRPAVYVRDVATLERVVVPAQIRRYNGSPVIELVADTADASLPTRAVEKVRATVAKVKLPSGYRVFFGRGGKTLPAYQGLKPLALSAVLLIAVATWLFRSLRLALLIALAAGATLIGTGAVLLSFGMGLSSPLWLGALLLLGIAAGHAGVLVAQCEASQSPLSVSQRLRRVARHQPGILFVLVLTAILGMLSLMWVNGGASILHTLIIVLAIGLLVSLLINLLLTPLMYSLATRKEQIPVS